uniref:Xyloglucan endotransglucosylase/hydrolase n=2 Tax=Aegilops tauschii subsp. strangulata TaxID=200361 RepID=A0A453SQX2_AEGTS
MCSCRRRGRRTTRSTSSSWAMSPASRTLCTPTCSRRGRGSGSSSSTSGSIPPTTSTPTPSSGTQSTSCKLVRRHCSTFFFCFKNAGHLFIQHMPHGLTDHGVLKCSFMVDDMPIRDFKNLEGKGIAFPKNQPMRLYSSLWNADDWATQGGRVKTDWSHAPFSASYRGFKADACVVTAGGRPRCGASVGTEVAPGTGAAGEWYNQELDLTRQQRMRWVQRNYMIYNYCTDPKRVAKGVPAECSM